MMKNMGILDGRIRVVLATLILFISFVSGLGNGLVNFLLVVLAIIFLVTAYFNFCPLYMILGINTRKKDKSRV